MDEENKSMEWLEGQTLTIPVEVYINMRIDLEDVKSKYSAVCSHKWRLESEIDDLKKELAIEKDIVKEYKAELEKHLGISELQKVKEMNANA